MKESSNRIEQEETRDKPRERDTKTRKEKSRLLKQKKKKYKKYMNLCGEFFFLAIDGDTSVTMP